MARRRSARFRSLPQRIRVPLGVAIAASLAFGVPISANATGVDRETVVSTDERDAGVSGVVTGLDGSPAGGVTVLLRRVDTFDPWSDRQVETDYHGSYSVVGIAAGTYTLRFTCMWSHCSAPYEEEWWKDRPDAATADRFTVAAGQQLTGMDAQLSSGSKIAGAAVGVDGSPIAKVDVRLFRAEGESFTASGSRRTDTTGTFLFDGLEPGAYTLEFAPPWESGHLRTWWGGSADQAEAVTFEVAQDQQLTGLRAQLRPGAVVTGVLTDADGSPLGGHVVELLRASGGGWVSPSGMRTRADGAYTFSGLEPGTYSLYYWSGGADEREFIGEYWLDKPEGSVADAFEVSQGQVVTGMDAQLSTRPVELPNPSLSTFSPSVGVPVVADVSSPAPGVAFDYQWFIDGNPAAGATGRSFVPRAEHFGADIRVRVIATAPGYSPVLWESHDWGPVRETIRLSGADRYETAVSISKAGFEPGVPVVYIASGVGFADALAGAPLAIQNAAPILLTPPNTLPDVVAAELNRLRPQKVVILGGTGVISQAVETRLATLTAGPVARLAGEDRYATAVAISRSQFDPGVPIAFLASGVNFPDALAGAPVAGAEGGPMLLTTRHKIPAVVLDELKRLKPELLVVLGGDGAISGMLGSQIDTLAPKVDVVAGADRYETAWMLDGHYPSASATAYVASGMDFPDALAGAPLVGLTGGRALLTPPGKLSQYGRWQLETRFPDRIVILGGPGAVSDAVKAELETFEYTG